MEALRSWKTIDRKTRNNLWKRELTGLARKKVRIESIDDSEQRAFFVFCVVLYVLALLVSPALIVTGVLLGVSELLFLSACLAAYSAGVLLGGSANGGSRARGIVGIVEEGHEEAEHTLREYLKERYGFKHGKAGRGLYDYLTSTVR